MTNFRKLPRNNLIAAIKSIRKSIRLKCYDCMTGAKRTDCESQNCPLFPYRPWTDREGKSDKFQKQ